MIKLFSIYEGLISENLGIQRLEAFLINNLIDVETIYMSVDEIYNDSIYDKIEKTDLIGISLFPNILLSAYMFVKKIKQLYPEICVFAGGQYFTSCYLTAFETIPELDFGVLGHGEYPLLDFINKYDRNNLNTIIDQSPNLISLHHRNNKKVCTVDINILP
jgi:radical SAM superfamily enzyme YgiQ (UPF0313 family)